MPTTKTIWANNKIAWLVSAFVLSFLLFGLWAYSTLVAVKINGEQYKQILQGKDMIADILTPDYEKHRAVIDEIVPLARERNKQNETAAALITSHSWQLIGLGLLTTSNVSGLCWNSLSSDKKKLQALITTFRLTRSFSIKPFVNHVRPTRPMPKFGGPKIDIGAGTIGERRHHQTFKIDSKHLIGFEDQEVLQEF